MPVVFISKAHRPDDHSRILGFDNGYLVCKFILLVFLALGAAEHFGLMQRVHFVFTAPGLGEHLFLGWLRKRCPTPSFFSTWAQLWRRGNCSSLTIFNTFLMIFLCSFASVGNVMFFSCTVVVSACTSGSSLSSPLIRILPPSSGSVWPGARYPHSTMG